MKTATIVTLPLLHVFSFLTFACLGEGEFADLDCGDHGHEHDGECHCDDSYELDGPNCVKLGNNAGENTDTHEVDCGEHGSAHGGHCHCHQGYMFDGETCVAPEEITEECHEDDDEHGDSACVCPETSICPCDGEIEEHGGKSYCIPELH
ncbi:MAG: hypothetical protein GY847_18470 [Proteobacteria bacterium]|nr:hypothetical protein [Pseudomonadota bacterium]